ncbi:MAG: hypothetical protein AAFQ45_05010 [Pseudomonadota bacterium]
MSASREPRRLRASHDAWWMAGAYGLGAAVMLAGYGATSLYWQHWWQYGAGMAVIALGVAAYAQALRSADSAFATPRMLDLVALLTLSQGVAALGGLIFLVGSGKLWAGKSDWLANCVFVAGGLAVAALSFRGVLAQRRLKQSAA